MLPICISKQHLGILISLAGTFILAFSVKVKKQKGYGIQTIGDDDYVIAVNESMIDIKLFWVGLACLAIGSVLQW